MDEKKGSISSWMLFQPKDWLDIYCDSFDSLGGDTHEVLLPTAAAFRELLALLRPFAFLLTLNWLLIGNRFAMPDRATISVSPFARLGWAIAVYHCLSAARPLWALRALVRFRSLVSFICIASLSAAWAASKERENGCWKLLLDRPPPPPPAPSSRLPNSHLRCISFLHKQSIVCFLYSLRELTNINKKKKKRRKMEGLSCQSFACVSVLPSFGKWYWSCIFCLLSKFAIVHERKSLLPRSTVVRITVQKIVNGRA